ncbi:Cx9C motif-containing protein 4, mitochondrial [Nakaseomyces bracarensis]|uniref:Cx9C motif-containing protein 4, mitochondrial n=1 Tax=Nakaseomyces bracarensis TaxID=273131 RepID=A0ABR4NUK6_9SACH
MGLDNTCQKEACKIQDCLLKNNYNETRCAGLIDALYKCCNQFYNDHPGEKSRCCPQPHLLELKMQQRNLK